MNSEISKVFNLPFKGERHYVQGADIAGALLEWIMASPQLGDIGEIDFSFHRMATHQLRVVVNGEPLSDDSALIGYFNFTLNSKRIKSQLLETDIAVTDRIPYDELDLVNRMKFDLSARRVDLKDRGPYSDLELWVAMTKALHQQIFQHVQGKWFFVRCKMPRYVRNHAGSGLGLVLRASFNDKMTRSEALVDGQKVADIYFSVVPPT